MKKKKYRFNDYKKLQKRFKCITFDCNSDKTLLKNILLDSDDNENDLESLNNRFNNMKVISDNENEINIVNNNKDINLKKIKKVNSKKKEKKE